MIYHSLVTLDSGQETPTTFHFLPHDGNCHCRKEHKVFCKEGTFLWEEPETNSDESDVSDYPGRYIAKRDRGTQSWRSFFRPSIGSQSRFSAEQKDRLVDGPTTNTVRQSTTTQP